MLTDHPSIEHLNIVQVTVTLGMWLGLVNYTSIVKMAEKKLITGMPTSLSYLLQICEHCVLAKQACTPVPKMWEGGEQRGY